MLTFEWYRHVIDTVAFRPRFLTVAQAAALLEVSVTTIWLWIERDEVPSELLPNGSRQISRALLLAWWREKCDLAREVATLKNTQRS